MKLYIKSAISSGMDINNHSAEAEQERWIVAKDPTTRPEILAKLAAWDTNPSIREAVARNPNTPTEVLLSLIRNDEDPWTRGAAMVNFENRGDQL